MVQVCERAGERERRSVCKDNPEVERWGGNSRQAGVYRKKKEIEPANQNENKVHSE